MRRFVIAFGVILLVLFAAQLTPFGKQYFVDPWTDGVARACTALMRWFDPMVTVHGPTIMSRRNGFAITIVSGCNGVEAMLVLVAAVLAYPAPWKNRIAGIAVGVVAIQALNLVRVISLFYVGQWDREWFEWAHLYLWQALIMLDAMIVWLLWIRWLPKAPAAVAA